MSLDDCEVVSKLLSPIYDVMPPVSGDWVLEVSSPGLERKLSKIDHFVKSIGEMTKVALNNKSQIVGKITSVNGDDILINSDEGNININFNDIKKAKTFIQW